MWHGDGLLQADRLDHNSIFRVLSSPLMILDSTQKLINLQRHDVFVIILNARGAWAVEEIQSNTETMILKEGMVHIWMKTEDELTHVIFLSFKFLAEIKLLGLQTHQPLPKLTSLLPEHTQDKPLLMLEEIKTTRRHSRVILEFVLIQMINVERLPALSQGFLLLLPLCLFLASFSAFILLE